ncbi:hypothetical protein KFE98_19965 [bacterium SCSIO 12741]|nr:hypothetical protein KFE98_19965 [bacterium SCSIO 12741]
MSFVALVLILRVQAQESFFTSDTLGYWEHEHQGKLFVLGERWYIQPESSSDTLYFSKKLDRNRAKAIFEFDQMGRCYLQSGRGECGKWGPENIAQYKRVEDTLAISPWEGPFPEFWLRSSFLILRHDSDTMILQRVRDKE